MRRIFLAFFWFSGLLLGALSFSDAGICNTSWMLGASNGTVSIVSLLCVNILPFLFSAFAVYIFRPFLLWIICFWKGFQFSFVSLGVLCCYPDSGWLVRWFLMFSDIFSLPLLFWFWHKHISDSGSYTGAEVFLFMSIFVLIVSIDYCYISTFLSDLLNS